MVTLIYVLLVVVALFRHKYLVLVQVAPSGVQGVTGLLGATGVQGTTAIQRNAMWENPTNTDNMFLFVAKAAMTLVDVRACIVGGTSVTWNLYKDASRAGAGTNLFTSSQVTNETTTPSTLTPNTTSISAGDVVFVKVSAVSGVVTQFDLTINMT